MVTCETDQIEVFFHAHTGGVKIIQASAGDTLAAVLAKAGGVIEADSFIFVSGLDDAFDVAADGDDHEPVEADGTLESCGIHQAGHVHHHRCHRVAVKVNYQNHSRTRRFSPARTIHQVLKWARHTFHLTDVHAENFVLQLCGTTDRPRMDQHLGDLVHGHCCEISFDLVPDHKIEG